MEELAAMTEKAKSSEEVVRYLKFCSAFREYSLHNTLLIWRQKPEATRVAGFGAWKKLGRKVKKGEKGIAILAPVFCRKEDEETENQRVIGFRRGYVFDVSQTEGEDLPDAPIATDGNCHDNLPLALMRVADDHQITIEVEPQVGSYGVSLGGQIKIRLGLSASDFFATLAHELAHEMLHQNSAGKSLSKKEKEIEAETVAHVVCSYFQIPTAAPAYLALHDATSEEILNRLANLTSVIRTLIEGVETHLADPEIQQAI
ncbi:MAG: DUF1738 domain-containing protein [Deltaproteobacteria bacterium]|nr:DUF1738 domain-containing protein [Deltaproteobacteria bacterium]